MYKGAVGIDALNERLQARLNPDGRPAVSERFRIGDRLIQTRNSHELGLMNGSIVFLREDDPEEESIVVDTDEGGSLTIPYGETATLRLAYAISVHKAQGCEVPVVVGVCHRSHARMLTRPLLYTAITRARSSCVLIGDPAALEMAVRRDDSGSPPLGPGRAPARLTLRRCRLCGCSGTHKVDSARRLVDSPDPEAVDGGSAVRLAIRIACLDPQQVRPQRVAPHEPRRARVEATTIDHAEEGDVGLV